MSSKGKQQQYEPILTQLFFDRYRQGDRVISFIRDDIKQTAAALGIEPPKNYGDLVYAFRYRRELPSRILETQPDDMEWIIKGVGKAQYSFKLVPKSRIIVNDQLPSIEIPEATPTLISAYALSDEQALLAKVRYNRLIDIFLGITSYSLQNHLRTSVGSIGQIEIDEIYLGVDSNGEKYVVPVQAKIGKDRLGVVQTIQDIEFCRQHPKFRDLVCRPVSAQFLADQSIALFELREIEEDVIEIYNEKHYRLVNEQDV